MTSHPWLFGSAVLQCSVELRPPGTHLDNLMPTSPRYHSMALFIFHCLKMALPSYILSSFFIVTGVGLAWHKPIMDSRLREVLLKNNMKKMRNICRKSFRQAEDQWKEAGGRGMSDLLEEHSWSSVRNGRRGRWRSEGCGAERRYCSALGVFGRTPTFTLVRWEPTRKFWSKNWFGF